MAAAAVIGRVATQFKSAGQVTERMMVLSALNTLYAVMLLKLVIGWLHVDQHSDWVQGIAQPIYTFGGSVIVAMLLASTVGWVLRRFDLKDENSVLLLLGLVLLALTAARMFELFTLLVPLLAGVMLRNASERPCIWPRHFGTAGGVLVLMLFVIVGATWSRQSLLAGAAVAAAVLLARAASKLLVLTGMARVSGRVRRAVERGPVRRRNPPFQDWSQRRIFDKPRFHEVAALYGYLSKQFTIFGQHVHIGCPSPDEALVLLHGLSRFIPHLIALSASSPFVQVTDTGFQSARLNSVFAFPLSGRAPFVKRWDAMELQAEGALNFIRAELAGDGNNATWLRGVQARENPLMPRSFHRLLVIAAAALGAQQAAVGQSLSYQGLLDPDNPDAVAVIEFETSGSANRSIQTWRFGGGVCPPGTPSSTCTGSTLAHAALPAGRYTLAVSQPGNFSFAENQGSGNLGDGFIGLAASWSDGACAGTCSSR